jgi:hypothetical protein
VLGCRSLPEPPETALAGDDFSGAMALAHVEALDEIGPRGAGDREQEDALRYLTRELEASGAHLDPLPESTGHALLAEIEGDSGDTLLLVARFSAVTGPAGGDDSGAGLLLELARVFGRERPPYTLLFAFAETPGLASAPAGDVGVSSLVAGLEADGRIESVRGVVVFESVSRPGIRLARDLRSHPIFRDVFWESAAALGYGDVFPQEGIWTSPEGLHRDFEGRAMDRVLVLVDELEVRPDLPRALGAAEPSEDSLEAVGRVSVEALDRIMHRLARIDALSL